MRNKVLIQALILGTGQVGGKILSLIFLFKFAQDVKPIGLYLYTYAYIPFSLFMDLSAFGLIPGVAKCVSKLLGSREENKIHYLLKSGTFFSLFLGIVFFIGLNLFNDKILAVSLYKGYTEEEYSIILNHLWIASYTLFIYPLISFYKGYLQGQLKMLPTAIAILAENLCRVLLYLYISKTIDISLIRNVFICNFISYLVSLILLFFFVCRDYFKRKDRFNAIYTLLKISLPFGMVTMFFTFYQLIDSITLSSLGIESHVYTAYMFETIRLIFIPIVLAQSVGGALNPKINVLYTNHKILEAKTVAVRLTNLMIYLLIPLVVVFKLYAKKLYGFFYAEESLYYILSDVSLFIFFIGFYKVMIGISQGVKKFNYIVISTFISSIAKVVLNIVLVPYYNYMGAVISTILAISICMVVSYYVLNDAKIKIAVSNLKAIMLSLAAILFSLFFSTIFRLTVLLNFSAILETALFCIFLFLFYVLFLSFLQMFKVSKAPAGS